MIVRGNRVLVHRFRFSEPLHEFQVAHARRVLAGDGWIETRADDWDLFWASDEQDSTLLPKATGRWRNHFPGMVSLNRKDDLALYLAAAAGRTAELAGAPHFDFSPRTFRLPSDLGAFRRRRLEQPEALWVVKPVDGWGGRDIALTDDPQVEDLGPGWIVQEHVSDPLLLPERPHKHVLRIYVLVTSLDPLVVYVSDLGAARFSRRPFSSELPTLADRDVHMVRSAVRTLALDDYRLLLAEAGIDHPRIFAAIDDLTIRLLIAHREAVLHGSLAQLATLDGCFELLGLDVLIDASEKPWLLEVNRHPALGLDAPEGSRDREAQRRSRHLLVEDTLRLVGLLGEGPRSLARTNPAERVELEAHRAGAWRRVFPAAGARRYLPLFQVLRKADLDLVRALEARGAVQPSLQPAPI